jgi:SAM-dependent methyltransferase
MPSVTAEQGRRLFGLDAATYASARPDYPKGLYELLRTRCGAGPGTSILEIGPGTGLVTRHLLDLGAARVRAIEPDPQLVEYLKNSFQTATLELDSCAFEDAALPVEAFDIAVAANSFHWVEQAPALRKVGRILRPGGWWAMWWMIFGSGGEWDAFRLATDHLFAETLDFPGTGEDGMPFGLDRESRMGDLLTAGFDNPRATLWRWRVPYETDRLIGLYSTFSPVRALPTDRRQRLLLELAQIADEQFGGCVERPFMTVFYTAQRPAGALVHKVVGGGSTERATTVPVPGVSVEPQLGTRSPQELIPPTFSQQAYWNCLQLYGFSPRRSLAVAVRLSGSLNTACLVQAFKGLLQRHECLRMRLVILEGLVRQEVMAHGEVAVEVLSLLDKPESERESQARRLVEELVNEPLDLARDCLFSARLLQLRERDHVLVLACSHMIADAASMDILMRDLWALYLEALEGRPLSLQAVAVQFGDYAVWLQKAQAWWLRTHGEYWERRLAGARGTRVFPATRVEKAPWGTLSLHLDEDLTESLREWSRQQHTSLVMTVLAGYVALLLRWCNSDDLVVVFQSAGRHSSQLEHTVGFLGSELYLRLALRPDDSFLDLLSKLTDEYYTAYEHYDFYRIGSQTPRPEFLLNPYFNWVPALDREAGVPLGVRPFLYTSDLSDQKTDYEPRLVLRESTRGLSGDLLYRADQATQAGIGRFAAHFPLFLEQMVQEPRARVSELQLSEGDYFATRST